MKGYQLLLHVLNQKRPKRGSFGALNLKWSWKVLFVATSIKSAAILYAYIKRVRDS